MIYASFTPRETPFVSISHIFQFFSLVFTSHFQLVLSQQRLGGYFLGSLIHN
jgi:hypothetical protein